MARFDVRDIPRSTLGLYAGGIALSLAGIVSVLIWYTGTLEPTPDQVAAAQPAVQTVPTATVAPSAPAANSNTPSAAASPAAARRVTVANTGGVGAVIRQDPTTDAKVVAGVPEGTSLELVGNDVQSDGRTWRNVKDDAGNRGFIAGELVK